MNRVMKDKRRKQEHHLHLEWLAGVTFQRFRQKQQNSGYQDHHQTPESPWRQVPGQHLYWLLTHDDLAKSQVENDDRTKKYSQRQKMKRLDDRKINPRIPDGFSKPGGVAPS